MTSLRVLLWDVRVGGPRRPPLIERIDADVLLLLGVSESSSRAWTERWDGRYHCVAGLELTSSPQLRPHGAMIASRWPLTDVRVIDALPKPERGLIATTAHPEGSLTLVAWGAPNRAGETRAVKMDAYRHMAHLLPRLPAPLVVGVDTNSWFDPPPGVDPPSRPGWEDEHAFLERDAAHGLVDVFRAIVDRDPHRVRLLSGLRPHGPSTVTFVRRPHRSPRRISGIIGDGGSFGLDRMDRIFVSKEVVPLACEALYHEALDAGGDHAAVVADLQLPSNA